MSWIKPTGFVDGGNVWNDEPLAYDDDTLSFAYADSLKRGWTDYLELTVAVIDCDKVRLWVEHVYTSTDEIEVDVYYSGAWHNIFSGEPVSWGAWNEYPIGSTESVTAMRIRFWASKAYAAECRVVEADFNWIEPWEPPVSDIDVGTPIIDRTNIGSPDYTLVAKDNPANATGIIHTAQVWAETNMTGFRVGTFYVISGNVLKCRDSQLIGDVAAGAIRTFSGLSIAVVVGDYFGCYYPAGFIEIDDFGGPTFVWGRVGEYIDPGDEGVYAPFNNYIMSLYGYGDIVAGGYYHGLKVQGEGELAICDVGTNPLRIRKGGVTYGLELVATDDPNASRIRVETGAGIKAIRKYT